MYTPEPVQTMRIAIVVPEEVAKPATLGRWLGHRLARVQLVAQRRRRARPINPRRFEQFESWCMPILVPNRRRRG